jgi:hypothetical protein
MVSETTNLNLDVFNVVGDGNMDFQTWSQKVAGEVDSNMVKIDDAVGVINGSIATINDSMTDINSEIDALANSPMLEKRQGGSPTNWQIEGTSNFTVTAKTMLQAGMATGPGVGSYVVVTFPVPFASTSNLFVFTQTVALDGSAMASTVGLVTSTNFRLYCPAAYPVQWFAIGEKAP